MNLGEDEASFASVRVYCRKGTRSFGTEREGEFLVVGMWKSGNGEGAGNE